MSDNKKEYTDSEKLSIVLEASDSDKKEVEAIAKKYGVSSDEILKWRHESKAFVADRTAGTEIANFGHSNEKVFLEANDAFIDSVSYGVVRDTLNYKRLTFWTVFGSIMLITIVFAVISIHGYTEGSSMQQSSEASQYFDLEKNRALDQAALESFGVVDAEAGIYRIPIDDAISIIVNE